MPLRLFQISLHFILPLALILGVFALALLLLVDDLTQRWLARDLNTRSLMVTAALRKPAKIALFSHVARLMQEPFEKAMHDVIRVRQCIMRFLNFAPISKRC